MFMFDEGIFTPSMHMLLIHNVLDNLFNVVCSTNFLRVSHVTRKLEKVRKIDFILTKACEAVKLILQILF